MSGGVVSAGAARPGDASAPAIVSIRCMALLLSWCPDAASPPSVRPGGSAHHEKHRQSTGNLHCRPPGGVPSRGHTRRADGPGDQAFLRPGLAGRFTGHDGDSCRPPLRRGRGAAGAHGCGHAERGEPDPPRPPSIGPPWFVQGQRALALVWDAPRQPASSLWSLAWSESGPSEPAVWNCPFTRQRRVPERPGPGKTAAARSTMSNGSTALIASWP